MRLLLCFLLAVTGWTQTGMMRVQRRAAAASPAICGHTAQETVADGGNANYLFAGATCTPAASSTVVDCKIYIGNAGGDLNCGVYDSDQTSPAGAPLTVICQGTAQAATPNAWNTISLSGCGTLATGHSYWVVANNSAGAIQYMHVAGGTSYYAGGHACCTLDGFGGSPTSYGNTMSMYLDLLQ